MGLVFALVRVHVACGLSLSCQGASWADSPVLANASEADFDSMDVNHGGIIDLQEYIDWLNGQATERKWHLNPLEMRAVNKSGEAPPRR